MKLTIDIRDYVLAAEGRNSHCGCCGGERPLRFVENYAVGTFWQYDEMWNMVVDVLRCVDCGCFTWIEYEDIIPF